MARVTKYAVTVTDHLADDPEIELRDMKQALERGVSGSFEATVTRVEPLGHDWTARQVVEAVAMLRALAGGGDPPDPAVIRRWLDDNHPGPNAHVHALRGT